MSPGALRNAHLHRTCTCTPNNSCIHVVKKVYQSKNSLNRNISALSHVFISRVFDLAIGHIIIVTHKDGGRGGLVADRRAVSSKCSIKMLVTIGGTGDPIAAPCIC